MKKKWFVIISIIAVIVISISLTFILSRENVSDREEGHRDTAELPVMADEAFQGKKEEKEAVIEGEKEGAATKEEEIAKEGKSQSHGAFHAEENTVIKKVELTDYVELPVEEFREETGIPLYQDEEGSWRTEDRTVWLDAVNGRITSLRIHIESDAEKVPYTIAGISLNDEVTYLEDTILKNAVKESSGGNGYDYYTSLELSRLGIENLTLIHYDTVDGICVDIDLSLKESAEDMEYIWGEKLYQMKEGPNGKSMAEIKYPCVEIPGNSQLGQNINNTILEAIKKLEDKIYEKTEGNVAVETEYRIIYMTSKLVSIRFWASITDRAGEKDAFQYCNINIAKNGEKAFLADIGITKEDYARLCEACAVLPVDIEACLEEYDTNWDQYYVLPEEMGFWVKALGEDDAHMFVHWYPIVKPFSGDYRRDMEFG